MTSSSSHTVSRRRAGQGKRASVRESRGVTDGQPGGTSMLSLLSILRPHARSAPAFPRARTPPHALPPQCFFCHTPARNPALNPRDWTCVACGQRNARDERGEMASSLPEMRDEALNEESWRRRGGCMRLSRVRTNKGLIENVSGTTRQDGQRELRPLAHTQDSTRPPRPPFHAAPSARLAQQTKKPTSPREPCSTWGLRVALQILPRERPKTPRRTRHGPSRVAARPSPLLTHGIRSCAPYARPGPRRSCARGIIG